MHFAFVYRNQQNNNCRPCQIVQCYIFKKDTTMTFTTKSEPQTNFRATHCIEATLLTPSFLCSSSALSQGWCPFDTHFFLFNTQEIGLHVFPSFKFHFEKYKWAARTIYRSRTELYWGTDSDQWFSGLTAIQQQGISGEVQNATAAERTNAPHEGEKPHMTEFVCSFLTESCSVDGLVIVSH